MADLTLNTLTRTHFVDKRRNQGNLILDPSFEKNISNWSGSAGVTITRDTSQHFEGTASLKVVTPAVINANANLVSTAIPKSGKARTYTVSAYIKGAVGGEPVSLVLLDIPSGTSLGSDAQTLTTNWKRFTASGFSTNETTTSITVRIMQTDALVHTFFVDYIKLEEIGETTSEIANMASVATLKARLTALKPASYTAEWMHNMTSNDLVYALRLESSDANGIN